MTIANNEFWNDTAGHRIEAHGGGFIQVGDTWYWIGEDKSKNSGNFFAVNCYADSQTLIAQAGWSLVYADSAETQAEDGQATNAFDGSTSTIWHTQYTGTAPAPPHEDQRRRAAPGRRFTVTCAAERAHPGQARSFALAG